MNTNKKRFNVFQVIAPIYGSFYHMQKRNYQDGLKQLVTQLDFTAINTVIDVGCGTGALASVLSQMGFQVTGIDSSSGMLSKGKQKKENQKIRFLLSNILERLPFEDKSFDASFASLVAHGFTSEDRKIIYTEMSRISKKYMILLDFNKNRTLLTDIAERLEGSDYFNFIQEVEIELRQQFSNVTVIPNGNQTDWYIVKLID